MSITYLMPTDQLEDDAFFWDQYHTLSPGRQQKINRFVFRKDKNLSLAAGLAFQAGLADFGLQKQALIIADQENGKPYLPEYPDLFFNISHSENLAICAFSRREIGADVEKVTTVDLNIARQFFDAAEYRNIMAADHPEEAFFDYWVLKESYMKATGLGCQLALEAFQIALGDTPGDTNICVYQDTIKRPYGFYLTAVSDNYKLAVCTKGDPPDLQLRWL